MRLYHSLSNFYRTVFTSIRERHWRLLLVGTPLKFVQQEMSASSSSGDGSHRINITNGLLLYLNHYSFYSQKASIFFCFDIRFYNLYFDTRGTFIGSDGTSREAAEFRISSCKYNERSSVRTLVLKNKPKRRSSSIARRCENYPGFQPDHRLLRRQFQ